MRLTVILLLLFTGLFSYADCMQLKSQKFFELKPLNAIPKSNVLQFNCEQIEPVKCEDIVSRLDAYSKNVQEHEARLLAYLQDIQATASSWYDYLSCLEGKSGTVPGGYFTVVSTGASDIDSVNTLAAQNHNCMQRELAEIIKATQSQECNKRGPTWLQQK